MSTPRTTDDSDATETFCFCSAAHNPAPMVRLCDNIPIFREALSGELSRHMLAVESCDLAESREGSLADLTVCGVYADGDWQVLRAVIESGLAFAVVPEPFVDNQVRALSLGASGVARRGAPVGDIVRAICGAARGFSIVETDLLRHLGSYVPPEPPFELSPHEVQLLQKIARGSKINALAEEFGYSSREMHRTMRRLYDRMHAANLYEALIVATRFGLLD